MLMVVLLHQQLSTLALAVLTLLLANLEQQMLMRLRLCMSVAHGTNKINYRNQLKYLLICMSKCRMCPMNIWMCQCGLMMPTTAPPA